MAEKLQKLKICQKKSEFKKLEFGQKIKRMVPKAKSAKNINLQFANMKKWPKNQKYDQKKQWL